jgi:cytosine/adenosine deaminase-related metal-dependent hydrolase
MIIKDAIIVTARSDAPLGHLDLNVGSIGIVDGSIRAVGPYEAVKRSCPDAAEVIECRDADQFRYLAMPGFVDGHSHSRQMAFQGYWASGWRDKHSRPRDQHEALDLFRWFLLEAVKAGVTFVADWPEHPQLWNPQPLDEELRTLGLRACLRVLLPHNRGESWPDLPAAGAYLRQTLRGLDPRIQAGIWIPEEDKHEFNDATLARLGHLQEAMGDERLVFQMHLAESRKRKEACPGALRRLLDHGLIRNSGAARTVFVHANWIEPQDVNTLIGLRDHVGVITCPKFSDGRVAPIKELLQGGVAVGLGPDVALPDPFDLIRELVSIHRSREESLQISLGAAFHIATLGGARAFGLEKHIGSLEPGKDASIVLVRNPAAMDPDLFAAGDGGSRHQERVKVIERLFTRNVLRREHVHKVILHGRVVVDQGVLLSRDYEEAIVAAGRKSALAIMKRLRPA